MIIVAEQIVTQSSKNPAAANFVSTIQVVE